jgi:pimeloyl-ACP methyl ester carboxylesterase
MLASIIISTRTRVIVGVLLAALIIGVPAVLYRVADPERLELNDSVRAATAGKFVKLSDGTTHYELAGPDNAPLVVLAAGYSVPSYIWDPTFKALEGAGYRVLRYDYFGRGFSDRPDVPYTDDFYMRQLTELLAKTGISGPFDLVGLSFGGGIITTFADRYPDRVRSLVYIDPAFRSPTPVPALAKIPPVWNFYTAVFDERWWADAQLGDFLHPERFPDWPARYQVQVQYKGFRRARLSEIVSNADVDQRPQIERVGTHPRPVLVIWGKQDPNVPFEFSETLQELMPASRLLAVDQSGHLPQWEQPEVTHKGLLDFLREVNKR